MILVTLLPVPHLPSIALFHCLINSTIIADDDQSEDENEEERANNEAQQKKRKLHRNDVGETQLHVAAKKGDIKNVRRLIRQVSQMEN